MTTPDDLYPTIIPTDLIPAPILVDQNATLSPTKEADIQLFNSQLVILAAMLKECRSVKAVLELHDRIIEMIPRRRALLGLEYGSPANKVTRSTVFEPVD